MDDTLKKQVEETLKNFPRARNSDITLTIAIWQNYYSQQMGLQQIPGYVALKSLYELPREDTIKRIRAKLQEQALQRILEGKETGNERYYLPTDEAVAKRRQINTAIWKKALGYYESPVQTQSEQLPVPVGYLGFTKIDDLHYLVDGSQGKKYRVVKTPEGMWSCECEAFMFSNSDVLSKNCKHIQQIIKFERDQFMSEAAKKQSNLF